MSRAPHGIEPSYRRRASPAARGRRPSSRRTGWCRARLGRLCVVFACAEATACAHGEEAKTPDSAQAHGPADGAEAKAPVTTLAIESTPVASLRSDYFTVLEFSIKNPSSQWHRLKRVSLAPDRRLKGARFEIIVGDRLRTWQLAARHSASGKPESSHVALATLAPDSAPPDPEGSAASGAPPGHLLALPYSVAPGLLARRWAVLYSPDRDGLRGQELVLEYELEDGRVESLLVKPPEPPPADH